MKVPTERFKVLAGFGENSSFPVIDCASPLFCKRLDDGSFEVSVYEVDEQALNSLKEKYEYLGSGETELPETLTY